MVNLTTEVIKKMIIYFDGDVNRINHALKVFGFAKSIGEIQGLDPKEQRILELSAVLHDIGIKESERKYNSSAGNYQEIEGPPIAMDLLKEFNLEVESMERISYLIGHHHSYNCIDGADFQILVEADFLVNIFEDKMEDKINHIKQRYFKTKAGLALLDSMYKK